MRQSLPLRSGNELSSWRHEELGQAEKGTWLGVLKGSLRKMNLEHLSLMLKAVTEYP
jgi:hypothetical protein